MNHSCSISLNFTFYCADSASKQLISSPYFPLLLAFTLLFSLPASILCIMMSRVIFKTAIVQPQTKILLLNCFVSAILLSTAEFFRAILFAVKSMMKIPLIIAVSDCHKQNFIVPIAGVTLAISMVVVAAERAFATKNYKSYEGKSLIPSVFAAILTWVSPMLLIVPSMLKAPDESFLPICLTALTYERLFLIITLIGYASLSAVSTAICLIVVRINRRRLLALSCNSAQLNLTSRFQLRNNIEMSEAVLPSVLSHLIFYGVIQGLYMFITLDVSISMVNKTLVVLCTNMLQILYTLAIPMSIIAVNRRLKGMLVEQICGRRLPPKSCQVAPLKPLSTPNITSMKACLADMNLIEIHMVEGPLHPPRANLPETDFSSKFWNSNWFTCETFYSYLWHWLNLWLQCIVNSFWAEMTPPQTIHRPL